MYVKFLVGIFFNSKALIFISLTTFLSCYNLKVKKAKRTKVQFLKVF